MVLPEASSPKMLGRESRSLGSKSFHPLHASPSGTGEPWRIRQFLWAVAWPLTPLAWVESSCTSSSRANWDITEWGSPCQQPLCSPPFLSRGAAWRWDIEVYICNWRESLTLEIIFSARNHWKLFVLAVEISHALLEQSGVSSGYCWLPGSLVASLSIWCPFFLHIEQSFGAEDCAKSIRKKIVSFMSIINFSLKN